MKCVRIVNDRKMNVVLSGELLEEVDYSKYMESHVAVDERIDAEMRCRME